MKTDPIGQFTETQSYTIRITYTEVFSDKKKLSIIEKTLCLKFIFAVKIRIYICIYISIFKYWFHSMQSYRYIQTNSRLLLCLQLFIHYTLFDSDRPNILSRQEFNFDGLFQHLYEEVTQYKYHYYFSDN